MKNNKRNTLYFLAIMLLSVLPAGLAACGVVKASPSSSVEGIPSTGEEAIPSSKASGNLTEIEVGIEPTPAPDTLTYINDHYGFKFTYPETFALEEVNHGVVLKKGTDTLRIGFQFTDENHQPGGGGLGAGDFMYAGKANFMGQVIPVNALVYEMKIKSVFFGEGIVTIDNLIFWIVLDDLETDYLALDIPKELQLEAIEILESFERIEATGSAEVASSKPESQPVIPLQAMPVDGWNLYTNQEYGFAISYPQDMSVVEGEKQIKIQKGTLSLLIDVRFANEPVQPFEDLSQIGELEQIGHVATLGEQVPIFQYLIDGQLKAVFFGPPGAEIGGQTELRFSIKLANTSGDALTMSEIAQFTTVIGTLGLSN